MNIPVWKGCTTVSRSKFGAGDAVHDVCVFVGEFRARDLRNHGMGYELARRVVANDEWAFESQGEEND